MFVLSQNVVSSGQIRFTRLMRDVVGDALKASGRVDVVAAHRAEGRVLLVVAILGGAEQVAALDPVTELVS